MNTVDALSWTVLVPVRGGEGSKSRLMVPADLDHGLVTTALARDTIDAAIGAVGAERLIVVTTDPAVQGWARRRGAGTVLEDRPGLAQAVTAGVAAAPGGPSAVLLGDLPSLHSADLAAALDEASAHERAFVPDRAGTGTVLLTAAAPGLLRPAFGPGSAARHRQAGHQPIDGPARLRLDVDDWDDLESARHLGVGPWTARALIPPARLPRTTVPVVQCSVHTFDVQTGRGSVLLDDGIEVPFDAPAFDASGLRTLHPGERLRVTVDGHTVTSMWMTDVGEGHRVA